MSRVLLFGLMLLFIASNCWAKEYLVLANGQVSVSISKQAMSRIAVQNDRIEQVIGSEDQYILDSDNELGQIFITPSLKLNQNIKLHLVTELGKIIDCNLMVVEKAPETIVFRFKEQTTINQHKLTYQQQIIELIQRASADQLSLVATRSFNCFKQLPNLELLNAEQYQDQKYYLIKARIKNNSKKAIEIHEKEFTNCMAGLLAVSLSDLEIMPGSSVNLYMVGQR